MAYADPQSVTIDGTATSLPRTSSGVDTGAFTAADGSLKLAVSHQYGKRTRRQIRLDHSKIAPDPLLSVNTKYSMSAYIVIDTPPTGYTLAEAQKIVAGLTAYLTASSGANVAKLLGGEN